MIDELRFRDRPPAETDDRFGPDLREQVTERVRDLASRLDLASVSSHLEQLRQDLEQFRTAHPTIGQEILAQVEQMLGRIEQRLDQFERVSSSSMPANLDPLDPANVVAEPTVELSADELLSQLGEMVQTLPPGALPDARLNGIARQAVAFYESSEMAQAAPGEVEKLSQAWGHENGSPVVHSLKLMYALDREQFDRLDAEHPEISLLYDCLWTLQDSVTASLNAQNTAQMAEQAQQWADLSDPGGEP